MGSKRKADFTPEAWALFLKRQNEAYVARKALHPDKIQRQIARKKARRATPQGRQVERDASRKRKTGFDRALVANLLVIQDGRCAVCRSTFTRSPHADHCHNTGKPRGLLCYRCNVAEGLIKAVGLTPRGFADRLSQYLDNPPANLASLA